MIAARPRVRVVHLVLTLQVGGLERVVLELARHSDPLTFETRVLCLQDGGPLRSRFEALGVAVECLGQRPLRKGRTLLRLLRWLRRARPDVLHTHNPTPHLFGSLAARPAGVPVVVHTKHGRNYPECRRAVAWNRFASWLSDRVVPVSADAADVASAIERVPLRKIQVIHNGIDLAEFPIGAGAKPGTGKRAVHVARLIDAAKDQTTLLRAARLAADRDPDFELTVVGDGPDRERLFALAEELGLGRHVRFLGYRSDVAALMASADLFVLSSLMEGLSLTLLEAMAAGLPVVATDVGGNREVVVPGQTGLLVPAGEPAALADAMLQVLHAPEQARRMGGNGRRRVEEQFSLQQMVGQYERLYLSLLAGRRPRGWGAADRSFRAFQEDGAQPATGPARSL